MKKSRKTTDKSPAEKTVSDHHYRCPACGALVDGRDRETMALHHRHILFPQQFDLRREGAAAKLPPPAGL